LMDAWLGRLWSSCVWHGGRALEGNQGAADMVLAGFVSASAKMTSQ
jgi:hypothetical protein